MGRLSKVESTLTDRYQTTIPEPVREALHLSKRDKIRYIVQEDGTVLISRAKVEDPVFGAILSFLAKDIQNHPSNLRTINPELVKRARTLVSKVKIDLDAPLSDEDE